MLLASATSPKDGLPVLVVVIDRQDRHNLFMDRQPLMMRLQDCSFPMPGTVLVTGPPKDDSARAADAVRRALVSLETFSWPEFFPNRDEVPAEPDWRATFTQLMVLAIDHLEAAFHELQDRQPGAISDQQRLLTETEHIKQVLKQVLGKHPPMPGQVFTLSGKPLWSYPYQEHPDPPAS